MKTVKLVACFGRKDLVFSSERDRESWSPVQDAKEICEVLTQVVPASVYDEVVKFIDEKRRAESVSGYKASFFNEYFDDREDGYQINKNESD
jgi:hypothetical protein